MRFDWKKMVTKGVKTGLATGTVTGGAMASLEGIDTGDKALTTAIVTIASVGIRMIANWWKNR